MMRNSKTQVLGHMLSALFLAVFSACVEYEEISPGTELSGSSFPINVYVDDPMRMTATRSSFTEYEMSRLTDLNVFIYREGKFLEEYSGYHEDASDVLLSIPVGTEQYDIYMVGNIGRVVAPKHQSDMGGIRHVVED